MSELKDLLPIVSADIGGEAINAVDARKLHAFLGVKRDFSTWTKAQIGRADFVEGVDFIKIPEKSSSPKKGSGFQGRIEYLFTISAAKELCMLAQTAKGKEARLYFIECEKIAKASLQAASPALPNFMDPAEAAIAWAEQFRKTQALENQIKADAPKVEFANDIIAGDDEYLVRQVAKMIGYPATKLWNYLREIGWVFPKGREPYAAIVKRGLVAFKPGEYEHKDGTKDRNPYCHIKGRGIFALYSRLLKEGKIARNEQLEMSMK